MTTPGTGADLDLCRRFRAGQDALSLLLDRHKGLAYAFSRRLFNRHANPKHLGCDEDDLLQEAHRGVMDAIRKWDPKRGSFGNCAHQWMRKRCLAFLEKCRSLATGNMDANATPDPEVARNYADRLPDLLPLVKGGMISKEDYGVLQAICAPEQARQEELNRMYALWWQQRKKSALSRVAVAVRLHAEGKGRKVKRRLGLLFDEAA